MFELLDEKPGVDDSGKRELTVTRGKVEIEQLEFFYQPERPIIRGLNLQLEPGRTLAVVGASGAGKSTLTKLLFRFYDPQSGAIRIDGQDIRDVSQASLRSALGIVPQDAVLFNDTLKNNLLYAREDASDEEVAEVVRMAHLQGLIDQCPDGLNTVVGERGLKLSGGEKQRIAIARMLLKRPAIMVFDEATSSLDSRTEKGIMEAIHEVSAGHTTLIIAHRLSTVVNADSIAVLEQRQLAEQGTHEELLAKQGLYAQLWSAQQRANVSTADSEEDSI